jgi:hypothetical protein
MPDTRPQIAIHNFLLVSFATQSIFAIFSAPFIVRKFVVFTAPQGIEERPEIGPFLPRQAAPEEPEDKYTAQQKAAQKGQKHV